MPKMTGRSVSDRSSRRVTRMTDLEIGIDDPGRFSDRHKRILKAALSAVCAAFILWLFATANYDISKVGSIALSPAGLAFIAQGIMSMVLGVTSAVFFGAIENRYSRSRLEKIYQSGPIDLIKDVLGLIRVKGQKGFVYGETIEYILMPNKHDEFLTMRVQFSYSKTLASRDLLFRVFTLKTSDDQMAFVRDQSAVDALYETSELFFHVPDAELRERFGDEAVDATYAFLFLRIAGVNTAPTPVPGDPTLLFCRVPQTHDLSQPVHLEYAFQYAVPKSDIVFGLAECLTKGLTIKFVRDGALAGKIEAEAYEIITAAHGNPAINEDPPGTHLIKHDGWVIPKSGAVFHWWPIEQ
ncbi:hypothetical protein GCM10009087_40280 [Sphingomonas oligophenolica]|uniref:DUF3137 domain-containing protein n=1 Tax=Sphingomonas oligophenolica TaxID=301154 RepID=A0ABU9Y242_9SPHN